MKIIRIFTLALLTIASAASTRAQDMMMPAIPQDEAVRVGKLDNGLTYYIRHNNFPENTADFYIAQRVGSINEEDSQRGLAHFLEHMAFNGSEHFPGNGIIEYTRSLGVEFGQNLNAYTSVDETVYNICNVPTYRQTALDSCLLILKDWSCGLTLADKDIDEERGVVHQEWQMGASAGQRFYEKHLPDLFPGSKYGHRMPIGLMEIIDNFKYQELRDYYKKWYRPDNQAIIVVGNVDVDHIEAEIKKLWSGVQVPADAAQVVDEAVPDNNQAIYQPFYDREQQYELVQLMLKQDVMPKELRPTMAWFVQNYMINMVEQMLNTRFSDLLLQPDAPFTVAQVSYGPYMGMSKTKEALAAVAVAKDGKNLDALKALTMELRRAGEHGFTDSEYNRAKEEYLSQFDKLVQNKDKQKNSFYTQQYIDNYLRQEPIPSLTTEQELLQQIAAMVPSALVNEFAAELFNVNDTNLVAINMQQIKDGAMMFTAEDMKETVEAARTEGVEALEEENLDQPLLAKQPKAGKIKKETSNSKLGYKTLTLSNGARVILHKTDFKDDEILMRAYANGGYSLFGAEDYANMKCFDYAMAASKLGDFSMTQLQKKLAGKQVSVEKSFGRGNTYLNAQSTPKDIETMMQLIYLSFTRNTKDEQSYQSLMGMLESLLKNKNLQPEGVFSDSLEVTKFAHNPRFYSLKAEDMAAVSYDRILAMDKMAYGNPGSFTFVFSGNFDEATLRPLIERYIASLPKGKAAATRQDAALTYGQGDATCDFRRPMDTPKAMLSQMWVSEKTPLTVEASVCADAIGQLLSMDYLRSIREENSAAYSVGADGILTQDNDSRNGYIVLQAVAPLDPEKAELADSLMSAGFANALKGVNEDDLQKVKENMLKNADEQARDNDHWLSVIVNFEQAGVDFQTTYKDAVKAMTADSLTRFINKVAASGNHKKVFMRPE